MFFRNNIYKLRFWFWNFELFWFTRDAEATWNRFTHYPMVCRRGIDISLVHVKDFDRAGDYALTVDSSEVWSYGGVKHLDVAAVANFVINAKQPASHMTVIDAARQGGTLEHFALVLRFLKVETSRSWSQQSQRCPCLRYRTHVCYLQVR